jgi:hypothetical protein
MQATSATFFAFGAAMAFLAFVGLRFVPKLTGAQEG